MRRPETLLLAVVSLLAAAGAAQAQNADAPLPKVYGPGNDGSQGAAAPAPPAPAPSTAAAPASTADNPPPPTGRQCKAFLGEPADARTMICALSEPRPIGEDCSCPFPAVPPPGVLPSPPAAGHVAG